MISIRAISFSTVLLGTTLPILAQGGAWQSVTPTGANANLAAIDAVTSWDADGSGPGGAELVIGAQFTTTGGIEHRVAVWDPIGQAWLPLGPAMNDRVRCLLALPDGSLYAGGEFTVASGTVVNGIARWTGTVWQPLGGGVVGVRVRALARLPNGEIVAGGAFTQAGGIAAANIARWNGSSWAAMGAGSSVEVSALAIDGTGALIANGAYLVDTLAAWNGASWVGLGFGAAVRDLVVDAGGRPVIAWSGGLFRLDPSGWTDLNWPANYSTVERLAALPDGSLLLQYLFAYQGYSGRGVQRWTGSSWPEIGSIDSAVLAVHPEPSGALLAGSFSGIFLPQPAGGVVAAPRLARYAATPPATASSLGGGCPSSGGANQLTATRLPWVGGALVTAGTGLPVLAFAVVVRGVAPASVPLSQLFTVGQPSCNLLVAPITMEVVLVLGGTATSSLSVPNVPTLIGAQFAEQWLMLELGAGLQIVSATSSNQLAVTVGGF